MTDNETIELLTGACRAYDRLSIVMDQMMEYWLEGNANPPKELIDAYYDAKDDVGEHINVGRIHEQIVPHNGEFYEKIESQFGLDTRTPNWYNTRMCKTTIIHVDADAFYAQLKAQSIKTDELKAKGYTPEKIDEMEEMNILKALNENQIKP